MKRLLILLILTGCKPSVECGDFKYWGFDTLNVSKAIEYCSSKDNSKTVTGDSEHERDRT